SKRYLNMCDLIAISCDLFDETIKVFSAKNATIAISEDDTRFSLTVADSEGEIQTGKTAKCGLYLLVAGFEESLRINGDLSAEESSDGKVTLQIKIEELYFHCGKSIKRSSFWDPQSPASQKAQNSAENSLASPDIRAFVQSAQFLLIATQNHKGDRDLSPRGDPAGFARILSDDKLLIPERPGNKIADSLTNLLTDNRVVIMLISPGCNATLVAEGTAQLTDSKDLLAASAVQDKIPKLGIEVSVASCRFRENPELVKMDLWNKENYGDRSQFPSLGRIISDQLQASGKIPGKKTGLGRMLGKAAGNASELLIQADYKKNLY
ncbi:MAG: pyridoxamine 5'-phosphate oxidase family protein, partial [Ketobacteraceae bacterium]|nr:pyridoxamine 5'-phosphate oxidase family protein [Ketobacteraceae bacterium]